MILQLQKDVGNLIRKLLYKYKEGEKKEVFLDALLRKKVFLKF
jgi:hypothetical protein